MAAPPFRPRASLWVGVGALATALLAVGAGYLRESPEDVTLAERERTSREITDLTREVERLRAALAAREATPERAVAPSLDGAPTPPEAPPADPFAGLPPERARQAADLAEATRRRARQELEEADRTAAARVRAEIERERQYLEDQARGGPMTLLRGLQPDLHLFDLVGSRDRFADLFERRVEGPVTKAVPAPGEDPLPDGTTISLAAGVHVWKVSAWQHKDRFPTDLLVDGAGMDETLLVLDEIRTRGEVRSLTFRDLTVHCGDNYLTDLRQEPITLRMERVRVVGFDMGAGGSSMLNAQRAAFYATDCRIEACFGRAPGFGNLFDVRGGLLARLEGCTVVGPFRSVHERSSNATVVFSRCRFERMDPSLQQRLEGPTVRYEDCEFSWLPREEASRPARRSPTEINPRWEIPR